MDVSAKVLLHSKDKIQSVTLTIYDTSTEYRLLHFSYLILIYADAWFNTSKMNTGKRMDMCCRTGKTK